MVYIGIKKRFVILIFLWAVFLMIFTNCTGIKYILYQPKSSQNSFKIKEAYETSIGHFASYYGYNIYYLYYKPLDLHLDFPLIYGVFHKGKEIKLGCSIRVGEKSKGQIFQNEADIIITSESGKLNSFKEISSKFEYYLTRLPREMNKTEFLEFLENNSLKISNIKYIAQGSRDTLILPPLIFEPYAYKKERLKEFIGERF